MVPFLSVNCMYFKFLLSMPTCRKVIKESFDVKLIKDGIVFTIYGLQ